VTIRTLFLSYYHAKRILRAGKVWMAVLAVPFIMAGSRVVFPSSSITLTVAWACPFLCAVFALGLVYLQREKDAACGFEAGLKCCPMPDSALLASRVLTWGVIFLAQMAVFTLVLLLRF